jgi:hypothetical protein
LGKFTNWFELFCRQNKGDIKEKRKEKKRRNEGKYKKGLGNPLGLAPETAQGPLNLNPEPLPSLPFLSH